MAPISINGSTGIPSFGLEVGGEAKLQDFLLTFEFPYYQESHWGISSVIKVGNGGWYWLLMDPFGHPLVSPAGMWLVSFLNVGALSPVVQALRLSLKYWDKISSHLLWHGKWESKEEEDTRKGNTFKFSSLQFAEHSSGLSMSFCKPS